MDNRPEVAVMNWDAIYGDLPKAQLDPSRKLNSMFYKGPEQYPVIHLV